MGRKDIKAVFVLIVLLGFLGWLWWEKFGWWTPLVVIIAPLITMAIGAAIMKWIEK